ncbi:MAG: hypothetical protein Q7R60_04165 [bacterium]|nr:hypothetical protein [bacterium]
MERKKLNKRIWIEIGLLFLAGASSSAANSPEQSYSVTSAHIMAIIAAMADLAVVVILIILIRDIVRYFSSPKTHDHESNKQQ